MFSVFVLGINIYVIYVIYPISSWAERVISPVTPDSKSHTK